MRTERLSGLFTLLYCLWLAVALSACTYKAAPRGNPHGLPPGQAKKITGSKSAKPYAPGQQKKY
ncbi:hypothetical protein [Chitinophaga pinensis]|uniref:Quinol oxidase subunit 4 n=1 Tax=Chitinophaga pinensis (strain ATCC 43595 / DSM 2588 / LMG 13176 / NBRC 15968 / NCIMB 11800 / UQM 2034) TaxID=485918 RepID=A0A979GA43_CHIPD|nr:hypothetical protein [Chitinophaga pinensis]ACU63507.1 hypothetical protein Cpin_6098 [Chitinophaga pinensis DSM 2588]